MPQALAMTDQEYVAIQGLKCPCCREENCVPSGELDADGATARQSISCSSCKEQWTDTWQLTGYELDS